MSVQKFRIGVVFPQTEIEPDALAIRGFAQEVENLGYSHIVAYDHIVGANTASRPDWKGPYSLVDRFHEPLTLFAHLAALTKSLDFMSGIVILPQRQTVLFAKQAATVDLLCNGRLRLGVAIGWNPVEYEALGVPFEKRGARLDDQIRLLRRLWTERAVTEESPFHTINDAGINPLPVQRPIPLWMGSSTSKGMERAARMADGWIPARPASDAEKTVSDFRAAIARAGRDPAQAAVENIVDFGTLFKGPIRTPEDAARDVDIWRGAGASGVAFHTMGRGFVSAEQHLDLLRRLAAILKL